MAYVNDAALVVANADFYTGPVGAAAPTDLNDIDDSTWDVLGHTSPEDILSWASEGGEATTIGSLQNPSLRTVYSDRTETFSTTLLQWDERTLKLYFGSNLEEVAGSALFMGVPSKPVATKAALLVVVKDGDNRFAIYVPSCEILRGDDVAFDDTENFAGLPISVTPINYNGNPWAYAVTPLGASTTEPGGGAGA